MEVKTVFQRYELKYMLTKKQKEQLLRIMEEFMALDEYGRTDIRNIYFDTDTYRLIRHSIEKPAYKEKLRVRSYGKSQSDQAVFVELKKKYKSIVYKRRAVMQEHQAMNWLCRQIEHPERTQMIDEIDYFCRFYDTLHPVVFLSYEREAFYSLEKKEEFRVTFDDHILYRDEDLSLQSDVWGTPILDNNQVLMELKTPGGIPLWMTRFLTQQRIYKTSYSKYGTAYQNMLLQHGVGGVRYA